MYCVKCKKTTDTSNEQLTTTKKQQAYETWNLYSMWKN